MPQGENPIAKRSCFEKSTILEMLDFVEAKFAL
jgi:hypothetical protein